MTEGCIDIGRIPAELRPAMAAIARAASGIARMLRVATSGNADGGQALTLMADQAFHEALGGANVRWYASARQDAIRALDPQGVLAVAMDPLQGAADLRINGPVGTVFSIYPAETTAEASFLRPARQQIAAGYVIHGPRCAMMVTFGDGVQHYALDPDTNRFRLVAGRVAMPDSSSEFAIDASNYRHWSRPIRAYIDDCLAGVEGPRETNFDMRWIACLVAEAHRILLRGGIFLCPSDARRGNAGEADTGSGVPLLFACAPIAFLAEQAGGQATDSCDPILDRRMTSLQQEAPFVFGSARKVARVAAYHDLPEPHMSALFGHRGLFRA